MSEGAERPVLLSIRDASRVYRMGEVDVPALRAVTLDVFEGEILVIVGASGSGKSTLLNLIGGMDRPTAGAVVFRGEDLAVATDRRLTLFRRREVGFVFQLFNLIPSLTALENVRVAIEIADDPLDPREALQLVDLGDRADHFPSQLSGGQQQRVAIARALASNPRMVLCDEPTGALDSATTRSVLELLLRLNGELGKTIVVITHERHITPIADRVVILHDGTVASITRNEERAAVADLDWT